MSPVVRSIFSRRMICIFLLGLSSGLPLLLVGSTMRAWMTEAQIDIKVVGIFALVGLPYTLKLLWAPLMDRYVPPFLDRRRGWIVVCQIALAIAIAILSFIDPAESLWVFAAGCLLVAFLSASQDIAIDAYRREVLRDDEQGLGSSMGVNGYRIGLLIAGAGSLAIAQFGGWTVAYLSMGGILLLAILATIAAPAIVASAPPPPTLVDAVLRPIAQFFGRACAFEILAFILLFKVGDQMASDMFNPFYLKIGYDKLQIAGISKIFGLWATLVGGMLGGLILMRVPLRACLWSFGILQMISTLGFAWLAVLPGPNLIALAAVVSFENLSSGLGMAAYVAFMAILTDRRFTATQYAALSSVMGIPRVFFGSASGFLADKLGWAGYFAFCSAIAVPGLLMLLRARNWMVAPSDSTGSALLKGFKE